MMKRKSKKRVLKRESSLLEQGQYGRAILTIPYGMSAESVRSAMRNDLRSKVGSSDFASKEIEKIIACFEIVHGDIKLGKG